MDFAKNILSKYGWQDGDGLGKDKQGIKKPIKANLKFDSAGLGSDATGGEVHNNWWERCFNDAAQNVKVQKEKDGNVIVDLKDAENSVEVSTKSYSVKKLKNSGDGVYGNNFLSADVSVTSFAMSKYKVLTDEELFQACGGRTAHKGARHGLKLSGKLARIEQQEKEMLAKMQKIKEEKSENTIKKAKVLKNDAIEPEEIQQTTEKVKSKKKKNKNQINERQNDGTEDLDEAIKDQVQKKKKRKASNEDLNLAVDTAEELELKPKSHKKKKRIKVTEESERSDSEENLTEKKKKKRKSI